MDAEEREEGEIVSELEDISDFSLESSHVSGKSLPHPDLLHDISLSSISDESVVIRKRPRLSRHHHKDKVLERTTKRTHSKKKKISKRLRSSKVYEVSSDSEGEVLDRHTLNQLKRTVAVHSSEKICKKPLQSRLHVMLGGEPSPSGDEDLNTLRTLALLSSNSQREEETKSKNSVFENNGNINIDKELETLRLEALKSAIIKKAIARKKAKEKDNNLVKKCDADKENMTGNINNEERLTCVESKHEENDTENSNVNGNSTQKDVPAEEEDVDVMRAMLLVSMSEKITSKSEQPISSLTNQNKLKRTVPATVNSTEKLVRNCNVKKFQLPLMKPLIINLNNDSDTESDIDNQQAKNKNIKPNNKLNNGIVKGKSKPVLPNKSFINKSNLKLLPKVKQQEYHILKQRLLLAKRNRARKSFSKSETKNDAGLNVNIKVTNMMQGSSLKKLQTILQEIQIVKDGRLQVKSRYQTLGSLLKNINNASVEFKQCKLNVKKLLEDLKAARVKLVAAEQDIQMYIKKLVNEKDVLDSISRGIITRNSQDTKKQVTLNGKASSNSMNSETQQHEKLPNKNFEEKTNTSNSLNGVHEDSSVCKYVSPLDIKDRNTVVTNPLTMLCPFELHGSCKDPDCALNHCNKKS